MTLKTLSTFIDVDLVSLVLTLNKPFDLTQEFDFSLTLICIMFKNGQTYCKNLANNIYHQGVGNVIRKILKLYLTIFQHA